MTNAELYARGKQLFKELSAIENQLEERQIECNKTGHDLKVYGKDSQFEYSQCTKCFIRLRTDMKTKCREVYGPLFYMSD